MSTIFDALNAKPDDQIMKFISDKEIFLEYDIADILIEEGCDEGEVQRIVKDIIQLFRKTYF